MNWASAQTHCSNLGSEWRLPTVAEMELSLIDTGRSSAPYIVGGSGGGNLFNNVLSSWYWTDTKRSSSDAFSVSFDFGSSLSFSVTGSSNVLCVKEAPDFNEIWGVTQSFSYEGGTGQERVSGEFQVDASQCGGAGTMYDTIANLCWERNPSTSTFTHAQAISRCESLEVNGEGGWRLPEKAELMTLLFHNGPFQTVSRLNSIGFSGIQNNRYWSNTLRSSSNAFSFDFFGGHSLSHPVPGTLRVLCVKTAP